MVWKKRLEKMFGLIYNTNIHLDLDENVFVTVQSRAVNNYINF